MSDLKPPAASRTDHPIPKIPRILPHERVFPIQIGSELFKLSGASLSSDAPSYFSQYFQCQLRQAEEASQDSSQAIRTLYIDRDPITFQDIALHLQGYHVSPRDGTHFVRLFADAQFYCLPKLISQLYDESIFMSIGHREFQIPRDLFTESGNSPNFFSLGFAVFFSNPDDLFPGLDREGLIRPPSILPPSVPGRSAETFSEILHLLRGYPVEIRSDAHRQSLLRDCRYFNFKGLEQKLIPHHISFNQLRRRDEIVIRIEEILKSGITVHSEPTHIDPNAAWVNYARPYVDDKPHELVLEIGGEKTKIHFPSPATKVQNQSPAGNRNSPSRFSSNSPGQSYTALSSVSGPTSNTPIMPLVLMSGRAEFFRDVRIRISKLFEVISTKLNLPPRTQPLGLLMASGGAGSQPATPGNTPISEDLVRVVIEPETSITLDGKLFPAAQIFGPSGLGGVFVGDEDLAGLGTGNSPDRQKQFQGQQNQNQVLGQSQQIGIESPPSTASQAPGQSFVNSQGQQQQSQQTTAHSYLNFNVRKRKRVDISASWKSDEWTVKTGQWRLRIQSTRSGRTAGGVECVLVAVKLDAYTDELARNTERGFLNS